MQKSISCKIVYPLPRSFEGYIMFLQYFYPKQGIRDTEFCNKIMPVQEIVYPLYDPLGDAVLVIGWLELALIGIKLLWFSLD